MSQNKKICYNRYGYLLEIKEKQDSEQKRNSFGIPQFNVCVSGPCKNQIIQSQVVSQNKEVVRHKPIHFQLQSTNFQIFKQKIQQKSSMSSFLAYTPSKDSQKQYFTIENEISTIQNINKCANSQRNLRSIQILTDEDVPVKDMKQLYLDKKQIHMNAGQSKDQESFWYVIEGSDQNEVGTKNKKSNDPIKVQQKQIALKKPISFKKHTRTLTQCIRADGKSMGQVSALQTGRYSVFQKDQDDFMLNLWARASQQQGAPVKKTSNKKNSYASKSNLMKTKLMSSMLHQSSLLSFQNTLQTVANRYQNNTWRQTQNSIKTRTKGKICLTIKNKR